MMKHVLPNSWVMQLLIKVVGCWGWYIEDGRWRSVGEGKSETRLTLDYAFVLFPSQGCNY